MRESKVRRGRPIVITHAANRKDDPNRNVVMSKSAKKVDKKLTKPNRFRAARSDVH